MPPVVVPALNHASFRCSLFPLLPLMGGDKFTEGWIDFALKGGIDASLRGKTAPHLVYLNGAL